MDNYTEEELKLCLIDIQKVFDVALEMVKKRQIWSYSHDVIQGCGSWTIRVHPDFISCGTSFDEVDTEALKEYERQYRIENDLADTDVIPFVISTEWEWDGDIIHGYDDEAISPTDDLNNYISMLATIKDDFVNYVAYAITSYMSEN